jgi:superfamily II DNA/RNA helicase
VLKVVPDYVELNNPICLNLLNDSSPSTNRIKVWQVKSSRDDKLDTLRQLLLCLNGDKTIVFANYRDSAERIHQFLSGNGIDAGLYHGMLGQQERECVVAMLNNGSLNVLIATDLAARGLDIDTVANIVHYHLPVDDKTYTHRNGRTARVNTSGNVYIITKPSESLPEWITIDELFTLRPSTTMVCANMMTIYFQAGKKEKISRGDIMGFIANNGGIAACDIGRIDVRDHYALAAVPRNQAQEILQRLRLNKIKGKKIRISLLR